MITIFRVMLVALASTLSAITLASAHEVQPAVADIAISDGQVDVELDWVLEAPVAGLDLQGLADTNAAENAGDYDRLRALPAEEFEQIFREAWPGIATQFGLSVDGNQLTLELGDVDIPTVENLELPRDSSITLSAPLPDGDTGVVMNWPAAFGPLVIRQVGVEDGYSAFLTAGGESETIPRTGGSDQTAWQAFVEYIGVGFDHIIPLGLDHILFVLGLFFLALRMGALLWQITAFTLAHTVTLALGALDIVRIPADIVEPLIAASIVYVGIENVLARGLTPWRPFVVFCFGLLHGLGFASVLSDFGLGASHFVPKLIGFNIGVEIGQLAVIAAAYLAFGALFGRAGWYFRRIAAPVSIGIAVIAFFWVLERTGTIDPAGAWAPFALLTEGGLMPFFVMMVCGGFALAATLAVMATGSDAIRELAGPLTSFVLFMGLVATFTSGAWLYTIGLAITWILAIRLQALGDDPEEADFA